MAATSATQGPNRERTDVTSQPNDPKMPIAEAADFLSFAEAAGRELRKEDYQPGQTPVAKLSARDVAYDLVYIADGGTASGELTYHLAFYDAGQTLRVTVEDAAGAERAFEIALIDVHEVRQGSNS
jgi:hypothetical protein